MGANQFGTVLAAWHPVITSIFTWKVFTERNTLILSILLEKKGIPFQFEPIQTSKTERSLTKAKPEDLDAPKRLPWLSRAAFPRLLISRSPFSIVHLLHSIIMVFHSLLNHFTGLEAVFHLHLFTMLYIFFIMCSGSYGVSFPPIFFLSIWYLSSSGTRSSPFFTYWLKSAGSCSSSAGVPSISISELDCITPPFLENSWS